MTLSHTVGRLDCFVDGELVAVGLVPFPAFHDFYDVVRCCFCGNEFPERCAFSGDVEQVVDGSPNLYLNLFAFHARAISAIIGNCRRWSKQR